MLPKCAAPDFISAAVVALIETLRDYISRPFGLALLKSEPIFSHDNAAAPGLSHTKIPAICTAAKVINVESSAPRLRSSFLYSPNRMEKFLIMLPLSPSRFMSQSGK
jgi:hypothetical protein